MTRDNYAITAQDIADQLATTPDDEPEPNWTRQKPEGRPAAWRAFGDPE